jgi:hypothetical protein
MYSFHQFLYAFQADLEKLFRGEQAFIVERIGLEYL